MLHVLLLNGCSLRNAFLRGTILAAHEGVHRPLTRGLLHTSEEQDMACRAYVLAVLMFGAC